MGAIRRTIQHGLRWVYRIEAERLVAYEREHRASLFACPRLHRRRRSAISSRLCSGGRGLAGRKRCRSRLFPVVRRRKSGRGRSSSPGLWTISPTSMPSTWFCDRDPAGGAGAGPGGDADDLRQPADGGGLATGETARRHRLPGWVADTRPYLDAAEMFVGAVAGRPRRAEQVARGAGDGPALRRLRRRLARHRRARKGTASS